MNLIIPDWVVEPIHELAALILVTYFLMSLVVFPVALVVWALWRPITLLVSRIRGYKHARLD